LVIRVVFGQENVGSKRIVVGRWHNVPTKKGGVETKAISPTPAKG
jgi:hypothetical protein